MLVVCFWSKTGWLALLRCSHSKWRPGLCWASHARWPMIKTVRVEQDVGWKHRKSCSWDVGYIPPSRDGLVSICCFTFFVDPKSMIIKVESGRCSYACAPKGPWLSQCSALNLLVRESHKSKAKTLQRLGKTKYIKIPISWNICQNK